MKYCEKCLTTDLRPNARFVNNICMACIFSSTREIRPEIIFNELLSFIKLSKRKNRNKTPYDCVVGVSGGKDSLRQAIWVRDRLKFNPLLVCVCYPPMQQTDLGAKNLRNLIDKNFDILQISPAPMTSAELSLQSFRQFGNVCKSTEMALFSGVPRIAIDYKIPLIFWGENPALQVGDSGVMSSSSLDGSNLRNLNTLVDGGKDWMKIREPYKLANYIYPSPTDFLRNDTQIVYLGAVWDDWSNFLNATIAALSGLNLRPNSSELTGDLSEASMLDEEFTNINMMIKYYKYGFGRATDQVNELIRAKKISRTEGIKLVMEMDGVCDDTLIESYCSYVKISINEFWSTVEKFVNWDLFQRTDSQRPQPTFQVGQN